jgi:hypothetical protein
MSQRKSAALTVAARASAPRESEFAARLEKFMSVMLTYLGFNVTKQTALAKFSIFLPAPMFEMARHSRSRQR